MSPLEDLRTHWASVARRPARVVLRSLWSPSASEYLNIARLHTDDPGLLLKAVVGGSAVLEPMRRTDTSGREYGEVWQVDRSVREFLWGLVRSVRPDRMLETGIADGASTRVVLDAMEANDRGALFGVDIDRNVGRLARESSGAHRWKLTVLPKRGRARALRALLRSVGPLDAFLHDSDHSYPWQLFEYREAWRVLAPGGWLLSDDANASYALMDFVRSVGQPLFLLAHPRKLFAVVRKGS